MRYKKKYILPCNFKAKLVYIFGVVVIALCIATSLQYVKQKNWVISLLCIAFTVFFVIGYLMFSLRGLRFKPDKLVIPKENYLANGNTNCEIFYNKIKSVKLIKKNENGPHIKGVFGDVDTIVFMDKKGEKYLFAVTYYSKKQISYIIKETRYRANLDKKKIIL